MKYKIFGEFSLLGRAVTNGLSCLVRSVLLNTTHNGRVQNGRGSEDSRIIIKGTNESKYHFFNQIGVTHIKINNNEYTKPIIIKSSIVYR